MSKVIKLKKGFDINLAGKAEKKVVDVEQPETFAIKPTDFHGILRPKLFVSEGDTVKAGTPIMYDKKNERVLHTAPVSGEIAEIRRGEKRRIEEIVILADKTVEYEDFNKYSISDLQNLPREEVLEQFVKSGVFLNFVQRPFGTIANPEDTPKAIFISGFDSHPLAPDYGVLYKGEEKYFNAGIEALKKLTPGTIHLNLRANDEVPTVFSNVDHVQINKFTGPHPAGCVGVQIHHIDPINKGDVAWTISPYGVIQAGKLFLEGKYDASKVIALVGSEVKNPQYYKTYTGASIKNFVDNNISGEHVRFISGNVLTGTKIAANGFIGFQDQMVTVIPEGDYYEFFGWIKPTTEKLSFQRGFGLLSFLNPKKEYVLDSNTHGEPRAFVQTGVFEKVTPMDILPNHLFKAILAEDFDDMEGLGIYEVVEEDLALCEFVDVSKHDVQAIVREGINLVMYS
ncbi:MAG: Na(+)-translocating NADH-quinone reductase subunit A [Candidatus Cyclobacteriaceae bacterium M2_1C_046]